MSDISRHEKTQRAIELLRLGFRSPIVGNEIDSLTSSTIREIAKAMNGGKRASSGPLPKLSYIITSTALLADCSLIAAAYRAFGGEAVESSIDMDALIKAHSLYMEIWNQGELQTKEPIEINRAWVMARDLRSDYAWLKKCPEDGAHYLVVTGQRVPTGCPWCMAKRLYQKNQEKLLSEAL